MAVTLNYLLELLQNADDNHFEAGVDPTLTIDLCAQSVSFHCNEVGFSESNVFALCSIGESTKAAAGAGYIGNKGIGFKSVFKLSPTPEVHSRDYHLRFDATNGGLGYIVPEPLAAPAGWDAVRGGTCVVLPLQEGEEAARIHLQRLRIHLSQIQPTLLLFLRRLTMLEVVDHSRGGPQANPQDRHRPGRQSNAPWPQWRNGSQLRSGEWESNWGRAR